MDSNSSASMELVNVSMQILAVLQRKFPLPACLKPDMISEQLLLSHGTSSNLVTNGLIYYLICIADSGAGRTIQWPIGTLSQAQFNSSIMKALTQVSRDHETFELSCRSSLSSILRDRKGPKFNKMVFELVRNALKITNLAQGSRTFPHLSEVPVDDRLEIAGRNLVKLEAALDEQRKSESHSQEAQRLEQLRQKKIGLRKRCDELMNMVPAKYRELMSADGHVQQNVRVMNQWQAELNLITEEQSRQNDLLMTHNNCMEAIKTIVRGVIAGENLVNNQNGPVLVKTANENNIELLQGESVSLSGFLESSCVITEKLKTLVLNESMLHRANELKIPLEQSSSLLQKMTNDISEGEKLVENLIQRSKDLRRTYEASIEAQGGHQFALPDLELEIRVDTPPAPYSREHLIQSPGTESPKRVLEEARSRRRDATDGSAGSGDLANTPKSAGASNRSRNAATSMSQLTKSVLQKQTLSVTLASHGNSTVGDMVPLSASSPVLMNGNSVKPPAGPANASRSARSSLADVLNELEESNLSFWDSFSEGSEMNSTFDTPEPPSIHPPTINLSEHDEGPVVRRESHLPVPIILRNGGAAAKMADKPPSSDKPAVSRMAHSKELPARNGRGLTLPEPCESSQNVQENKRPQTAPAASPIRHPRRSIQNLIERLQKLPCYRANHSKFNPD